MKLCPDCLSNFKSKGRKRLEKLGLWGKNNWPSHLYHDGQTRKCEKHHAQSLADSAARRSRLLSSTPSWADKAEIKNIYAEAIILTKKTGVKHEVDHVVPLKGAFVCGLHVASNLRPIPHYENRRKSNKFDV